MPYLSKLHSLLGALAAAGLSLACATASAAIPKPTVAMPKSSPAPSLTKRADFGREHPSREALQVARWVLASGDNHGDAFVLVDKPRARIYVFEPNGRLRGAAPVLLGLARGDDTVPGIGDKKLSEIKTEERTTPAGRFVAEPGRNARGEDIVWVDYDAAVSMHRVITSNPAEHRLQRLATPTVKDNRISYGCINLPVSFYEKVLSPTVAAGETIVYVLPETRPASVVFGFREGMNRTLAKPAGPRPTLAKPETAPLHWLDGA